MKQRIIYIILSAILTATLPLQAQTEGAGSSVFNFLNLPTS